MQWIRRANWSQSESTLTLSLVRPDEELEDTVDLHIFLSLQDACQPAFCYCDQSSSSSVSALVADLNDLFGACTKQLPMLQLANHVITQAIKHKDAIWNPEQWPERRARIEAELLAAIHRDPLAFDVTASLLFFAMKTFRRHTVMDPFPPHLCSARHGGSKDFAALEATLEDMPAVGSLTTAAVLRAQPIALTRLQQWLSQDLPARLQVSAERGGAGAPPSALPSAPHSQHSQHLAPLYKYTGKGDPTCPQVSGYLLTVV
jgi:hypothetical protein